MSTLKSKVSAEAPVKGSLFFTEALETFLSRLPARSRHIVEARFGVGSAKPQTLEEIGQVYKITRERVRQVIGSALGFLSGEREHPIVVGVSEKIRSTLVNKSGIMRTEEFLDTLSQDSTKERGALLAFIECLSVIEEDKAGIEREKTYHLKDFPFNKWEKVKEGAKSILASAKEALDGKDLYSRFKQKNSEQGVTEKEFFDYLSVSREVKQNVFGKWGLSGWSDIKPRGTRERAHLVLKTTKKPLHFREIATLIDSYGLHEKKQKSHPQTVHNELIKDKRFVLVGRGIYALSDWGYKKGTVKEVLDEILSLSHKPLSREEVLTEVLKVRQVKKSTVIINLNTFFLRVGKNAYTKKK